jgi:hypothetical protein
VFKDLAFKRSLANSKIVTTRLIRLWIARRDLPDPPLTLHFIDRKLSQKRVSYFLKGHRRRAAELGAYAPPCGPFMTGAGVCVR